MNVDAQTLFVVERHASKLRELALRIHAAPEVRFEERRAADWIAELLDAEGHVIERGIGGLPTALRARSGSGGGPRVAILAEYDALPGIGHACGHHLIAAAAVGAFLGVAPAVAALGGEVVLLGTPGEEGGGGKIRLLRAGAFEGVDAAVMFHPMDRDVLAVDSLASEWLGMRFTGRASHAAAAPWDGASALTGVLQTFQLVDSQRQHLRDGVRVHGIVTDGGTAVNVIPERASCEFTVRAPREALCADVAERVARCARGAAEACGLEVEVERRKGYADLRNNQALARAFGRAAAALGRELPERDPHAAVGSTDLGDVSQVVPAIHPYLAICAPGEAICHQPAFAEHGRSDRALEVMLLAAKALALTATAFIEDASLRAEVRAEFERGRAADGR
jgi:amidohydrolase